MKKKVCELIEFDIIGQQVLYAQGFKTRKSLMKRFQKGDKIYDDVYAFMGEDYEDYYRTCNGWVSCVENKDNGTFLPIIVMTNPIDISNPKDLSILAHEVVHVVQRLREKYCHKQEVEFEAYMFEFIFYNILKFLQ